MNPKHSVIKNYEPSEETITIPMSLIIHTLSYYEELTGEKEEVMTHKLTSKDTLLSDIISCMSDITNKKTKTLKLEIKADHNFIPKMITKTIITKQKSFK